MTNHGLLIVDKNGYGTQTFLPDSTISSVYRRVGYSDGTWGAWSEETLMSPDDVTRLKSALTKSQADAKYASVNHTHTAAQVHARADDWMPTAAQIGGIFPYSDCGDVETDLNTLVIPGLYKVNNYKAIHTFYSYSGKYEYIIVSSEGLNSATVQLAFLCTSETSLAAYVTIRATTDCITWTTTVSNADLSQLSNTLAKADLSNITNAIFKEKAESAGVGGGYVRQSTAPADTTLLWMDCGHNDIMKYYNGTAWTPQPSVWG
jgi:hypothetical protein